MWTPAMTVYLYTYNEIHYDKQTRLLMTIIKNVPTKM